MDLLNLSKEESLQLLDMRKNTFAQLNLNKPQLVNHKARVGVVLDYSGSMKSFYKSGKVQAILERLFPIALQFDDNGAMDVWIFSNGNNNHRLPEMTKDNYYGYVDTYITGKYRMGGTDYAPVMEDVADKYTKEEPQPIADYIIFITDGDNFDKPRTETVMRELSNYPIFWQFVGIGGDCDQFPFLDKLDDMQGRTVDNADFFAVSNVNDFYEQDTIYQFLTNEYASWLVNPIVVKQIEDQQHVQPPVQPQPVQPRKKLFGLF